MRTSKTSSPTAFVLHEGMTGNAFDRTVYLERAVNELGLSFCRIDSKTADYSKLPRLEDGDILYNAGRGSARLETLLMNENAVTFYDKNPTMIFDRSDSTVFSALHERCGIPTPRTIHKLPASKALLGEYVKELRGFPIVLKVVGGTGGTGTIVVESMRSLLSVYDTLYSPDRDYILREFIEPRQIVRLTVLGGKVIASNFKPIRDNDFRSTAQEKQVEPRQYNAEICDLAVRSTEVCGLEFGGVDILIDRNEKPFVLELNFPCDFVPSEIACDVPISRMMMQHLNAKSRKLMSQRR